MEDDLSLEYNKDMSLIQFDDQQKTKIGAALQALADQMAPTLNRQLLSNHELDEGNEGEGVLYNQDEFGEIMTSELKRERKDESSINFISIDCSSAVRNKDETEIKAEISIASNQSHFNQTQIGTTNDLSTCITLTKEEPQLQNFEIEPPAFSRNEDETEVKAGISISSNRSHFNQTLLGTMDDLSTCITLTKEEPQLQSFEIEPLAFSMNEDETEIKAGISISSNQSHFNQTQIGTTNDLSTSITVTKEEPQLQNCKIEPTSVDETYSVDLACSNEIESTNMHYISDEESRKDSENIVDSLESDSEDDKKNVCIDYTSFIHYICPECGVDCGFRSEWKSHTEKQHLSNTVFSLNFSFVANVDGESCYQCRDCNKKFSRKTRFGLLQEHHIKHLPYIYYLKCVFCDKRFQALTSVYSHIKQTHAKLAHPNLKKRRSNCKMKYVKIFCPICQQSQSNLKLWEQHLTEKHDYAKKIKSQVTQLGKNIYSCNLCQQKIHQTYNIKLHMLLHEPNNSFQCILCEKYHTYLNNTHMHIKRKHLCNNQDKLLKCSFCEATFAKKSLLCNHNQNVHKNELSKYTAIRILPTNANDVESGVSNSLNQINFNHLQPGTTKNLSTKINLTKEESQVHKFEVEPPAPADETFSAHSMDLSYSNEIESINMQYISDEGSVSKNSCNNEKDNEVFVDSIESEFQDNQNDEPESVSKYKGFVHYICPECGLDCGSYSKWRIHTEKQHKIAWPVLNSVTNGESSYQCLYCNKKLGNKIRFRLAQEHQIKHMPHKYYLKCGFCDKKFLALSNVYPHIKQKHEELANPFLKKKYSNPKMKCIKIFCPICQQSQPNIKRWQQHLTEKHDYENKMKSQVTQLEKNMYSCQVCQQNIRRDYIKLHMLLHEPNKSFQCILCKKYETQLSAAVRHIRQKHRNYQDKVACSYCDATFTKKSLLWNNHQNYHRNEMSKLAVAKDLYDHDQSCKNVSSNEDESDVESSDTSFLNKPDSNQTKPKTKSNLPTYITLFDIVPPAADEKFSTRSEDLCCSNEMENITDEESDRSKDCSNEKNENVISTGFDSQDDDQNVEQESIIANKGFVHYICPECGIDCGPYSKWKLHTDEQHTISWFNFSSIKNMRGESRYQCLDCNKKFSQKMGFELLQEHRIKHLPHRFYLKCGVCDKRFLKLSSVYTHIKKKHAWVARSYLKERLSNPKMEYIRIFCPICQQLQSNIKCWHQHLTDEHDYENKIKSQATLLHKNKYSCQLCQKEVSKRYVKMHMLLHEPNKSFQCILCKKYETHLNNILQHMGRKHFSNDQQKLCSNEDEIDGSDLSEDCTNDKADDNIIDSIESESQDQKDQNDKQQHVIDYKRFVHYICPECGEDCGSCSKWKLHTENKHRIDWLNFNLITNVHGESSYQCPYCEKKLSPKMRLSRLKQHRIKHMPYKYFLKCGSCDKGFQALPNAYAHIKKFHIHPTGSGIQK